jgi:hypothetical protein
VDTRRRFSARAHNVEVQGNLLTAALKARKAKRLVGAETDGFGDRFRKNHFSALRGVLHAVAGSRILRGIDVENADVTVLEQGRPLFSANKVTVEAALGAGKESAGSGSFSAAELAVSGGWVLSKLSGYFSGGGERFDITRCKGTLFGGKAKLDAHFDYGREKLTALTFSVDGLDFDKWYRMAGTGTGRLAGRASFDCALDSSALCLDSLRGKGTVSVEHLVVADFPFQKSLVALLVYPGMSNLKFSRFKAEYTISPDGVITSRAEGKGDSVSIKTEGWIKTAGTMDAHLECTIHRKAVPALPPFAQKSLDVTRDGGRLLRCRLYGPLAAPKFSIESKTVLERAVRNVFEDVQQNLQQWFR